MTTTLTQRITAKPRTTLLGVLFFLIVAGLLGGGVAGSLGSDGFDVDDSPSVLADQRIAEATDLAPGAGVVLLLETEQPDGARVAEVEAELAA
ncbi:MAG: hypothetical protein ACXWDM_10705, partial [Nocardioides sp.]